MSNGRLYLGISIYWLALSMVFDGLSTLVLPDYLLNFAPEAQQATVLGLITFVGLLLGMLVQPLAGRWSDQQQPRWGRRGTIGLGTALLLMTLFLLWASPSLPWILLSYSLVQAAAATAQAAQQGFIPDLVPSPQRGMAAGWKGFMDIGGALLGFLLLGALLGDGRIGAALLALGLVLIAAYALTLALVRERPLPSSPSQLSLRESFQIDVQQHPVFARLVLARFCFLLGVYAVGRFLLYFVADRLHLDREAAAEQAGGLLAGLTLITVLAAPLMGWVADRSSRRALMIVGGGLSAAGVLALVPASSSAAIFAGGTVMALGTAAFSAANWAMTADVSPPEQAAHFLALANYGTAGAAAAAGLFGILIDQAGYTLLFIGAALAYLGSAALIYRLPQAGRPVLEPSPYRPGIQQEEVG